MLLKTVFTKCVFHQQCVPVLRGVPVACCRLIHTASNSDRRQFGEEKKRTEQLETEVMRLADFNTAKTKSKKTFIQVIHVFIDKNAVYRRGQVEFIRSALRQMKEFNVDKDLAVYKELIKVFPEDVMVPQNVYQMEGMHYPKHQHCALDLLEQMECNGVQPDIETKELLIKRFGRWNFPLRKLYRMSYWMTKFKHASPWPLPRPLPDNYLVVARMVLERITGVDLQRKVHQYYTDRCPEAMDHTWLLSSQSPQQRALLEEHSVNEPLFVEGPFKAWARSTSVNYFLLRAKAKQFVVHYEDVDDVANIEVPFLNFRPPQKHYLKVMPTVHEQDDGVIMAVAATGTSSKDSLQSWIRILEQEGNPKLAQIPVVFTLRTGFGEIAEPKAEPSHEDEAENEEANKQ